MWTLNPFKKHDVSEFPGVLVPLDQAPHRASIAATRNETLDEKSLHKDEDSFSGSPSTHTDTTVGLTLEQLRAEIDEDVAAGDIQTAYDRKSYPSLRINKHSWIGQR
jgi:hypothetical protein